MSGPAAGPDAGLRRAWPGLTETERDLLRSAADLEGGPGAPADVLAWMEELNRRVRFRVQPIPIEETAGWRRDAQGNLRHESGRFFSVEGLRVRAADPRPRAWSQPVLCQPEVGILGFLCQKRDGLLRFLVQGKFEPGNANGVQLSPTVQATRSNYSRVHGGALPPYLEFFTEPGRGEVLADQLHSEQGYRYVGKRNRNAVVRIPDGLDLPAGGNFRWLTLGQIKRCLRMDDAVNMDARSVLSTLPLPAAPVSPASLPAAEEALGSAGDDGGIRRSLLAAAPGAEDTARVIAWLDAWRKRCRLDLERCDLGDLADWAWRDGAFRHRDGDRFEIVGVRVEIGLREVAQWCQPLMRQPRPGLVGFLARPIGGVLHLLAQARLEPGFDDLVELGPTVQVLPGDECGRDADPLFLDWFEARRGRVLYEAVQSEEGGRFYRERSRHLLLLAGEEFPVEVPDRYTWLTFRQARTLLRERRLFNVEARSLLACVTPL